MEVDPVKKHTKRLLPAYLTSEKAHGPINKADRSAGERAALEKRKLELLQSRTREQIEVEYSGQAVEINKHLDRKARRNADIDEQLAQLRDEHDMEVRVIKANLSKQDEKREAADAERQQQQQQQQQQREQEQEREQQQQQQQTGSGFGNAGSVNPASGTATKDEAKDDEHEEGEIEMTG